MALVALYRPGPMEHIPNYCNVKNGREKRESLHPRSTRSSTRPTASSSTRSR